MLRRIPAGALFVGAMLCFTCSAPAQSSDGEVPPPGFWHGDGWTGYVPAHLRHKKPAYQAPLPALGENIPASFEEDVPMEPDASVFLDEPTLDDLGAYPMGACDRTVGACDAEARCRTSCITGRADYLLWWTQGMHVPALVTTGSTGALDQPDTEILFGDSGLNSDSRSGGRFTLSLWRDPCRRRALEATYMTLGEETAVFTASDDDYSVVARPFFNVGTGLQDARLIASPNFLQGSVSVTATTDLQGMEILSRKAVERGCRAEVDFLWGYRWVRLQDRLLIEESTLGLAVPNVGNTVELFDMFDTTNSFHGGVLGVNIRRQVHPLWTLDLLGKVALGGTRSVARVDGQTTATDASGGIAITDEGLLTQSTNIGRYERSGFTTVSEFGVTLRRRIKCGLDFTFGYTLVYWNQVARAGNQVDFGVNRTDPLSGEARPAFSFETTDFWAQGMHFGLEYAF